MKRERSPARSEPLEPIELPSDFGRATTRARPVGLRARAGLAVVAVLLAGVAAFGVARNLGSRRGTGSTRALADISTSTSPVTGRATPSSTLTPRPTQATAPIERPNGPIPGRFYPAFDRNDTTTFVLLSGLKIRLAGGVTQTIGGLGAVFGGSVSPKDAAVCCSVNFEIDRGAPSDLFDKLGSHALTAPVLMSPTHARHDDLKQGRSPYAILSTGGWTLIATSAGDPAVLTRLNRWRLRSTPYGVVLGVPADSIVDNSTVVLGRTPDLSDRQVELTENSCPANADTKRTLIAYASGRAVGYWCVHRLRVRIEGSRSYVESAIAHLQVNVGPNA